MRIWINYLLNIIVIMLEELNLYISLQWAFDKNVIIKNLFSILHKI